MKACVRAWDKPMSRSRGEEDMCTCLYIYRERVKSILAPADSGKASGSQVYQPKRQTRVEILAISRHKRCFELQYTVMGPSL